MLLRRNVFDIKILHSIEYLFNFNVVFVKTIIWEKPPQLFTRIWFKKKWLEIPEYARKKC